MASVFRLDLRMSDNHMHGKTVLIIDDDCEFLTFTSMIFKESGAHVIETSSGLDGMGKLLTHQPDLVVLETMIAGGDGFQICQQIRQLSNTPLIILTALSQDKYVLKGLEAGADDFLSKHVHPQVLLARAQALMRRSNQNNNYFAVQNYNDDRLGIDFERHRVFVVGKEIRLTSVEFKLLAFLASNEGRVLSYKQILSTVWEGKYKSKYGYVHVYISYLRSKIEPDPRNPQYIRSVPRVGYIFEKQSQAVLH
jgi:DNA-binding response OmpR family regulator